MIPKPTTCPSPELLRAFLAEALSETEEAHLQEHVGGCATCQAALESAAGEPELWSGLREHLHEHPDADDEPEADALRELKALLGPTDDPRFLGRIGDYEVQGLVGRGTTGLVMKAYEPRLERYVAIKLLAPRYRSHGSARAAGRCGRLALRVLKDMQFASSPWLTASVASRHR